MATSTAIKMYVWTLVDDSYTVGMTFTGIGILVDWDRDACRGFGGFGTYVGDSRKIRGVFW